MLVPIIYLNPERLFSHRQFGFQQPLVDHAELSHADVPEVNRTLISVDCLVDQQLRQHWAKCGVAESDIRQLCTRLGDVLVFGE